ncbi:MAG: MBL fold metallo-hydrolase [Opitutaceae bacterium]|nr:MBL fold metallo-hydrolase [Opitutaceae bacterium]
MKTPLRLSLVILAAFTLARADQKTKTLDFHWIDSEGGGSTLIVTPEGESVLIDTGNPGGRDPARIVAAAKAAGLAKIDHVIITHWHTDHFGGAAEVAQQIPFGTIHQREIPAGDPDGRPASSFPIQIKPFRDIPAKRAAIAPGTVIPLKSGGTQLELRCLAADQKFVAPTAAQKQTTNPLAGTVAAKPKDPSDNANSAVYVLTFGAFRFFAGGDLTWNLEEQLVAPHNLAGTVDVYQTNHHGLEVSNHPSLVRSLAPTVVVMNNGPKKGGQPGAFAAVRGAASVQALYQIHHSHNVPTETNAPAEFVANQGNLTDADAAKCPAHQIRMSVAPDGRNYTVSVPSTGHARTFRTKG